MSPEEVKDIRNKLKLTQEAFAHAIGVGFVSVNRWENGKSKPTRLAIEKMKSLLKEKYERN